MEKGYIGIPTQIIEQLAGYRISGEEWQVLLVIIRKTWGWHKQKDRISLSQFVELTKIKKPNIIRAIKKLENKKIIIKKDNGIANIYNINKDFLNWKSLSKKITLSKKIIGVIKKDNLALSKKIPTIDTITKETITKDKYADFVYLLPKEYLKLCNKYGENETKEMIEILNNYKGANGKKYKSDYHAILNWVIEKFQKQNKNQDKLTVKKNFEELERIKKEEGIDVT